MDAARENQRAVALGRERRPDRGNSPVATFDDLQNRAGRVFGRLDANVRVGVQEGPALVERDRVRDDEVQHLERRAVKADQALFDAVRGLVNDVHAGVRAE